MIAQNLRYWAKWIASRERDFQARISNSIAHLWKKDPDMLESIYASEKFARMNWYSNLRLPTFYPPEDFSLQEFMACWPEFEWGQSAMQDARILAGILQIKDHGGSPKDIEKVADSIRKEIEKHGNLRYEWIFVLWAFHKERIRQRFKDDAICGELRKREIA